MIGGLGFVQALFLESLVGPQGKLQVGNLPNQPLAAANKELRD